MNVKYRKVHLLLCQKNWKLLDPQISVITFLQEIKES